MSKLDLTAIASRIAARVETRRNGEILQMFADYKSAAKLATPKERNDVVDAALASLGADGDADAKAFSASDRSRVRTFFGASRHFNLVTSPTVSIPSTEEGKPARILATIFADGNKVTVSEKHLLASLKVARSNAVDLVDGAKPSDLSSTGGENYGWAAQLNKTDGASALVLLTVTGMSEFFASRLRPAVETRIAAEKAAAEKAAAEMVAKAAAEKLTADRDATPPATTAPATTAPATTAPATTAPATSAPIGNGTKPVSGTVAPQAPAPQAKAGGMVPGSAAAPAPSGRETTPPIVDGLIGAFTAIKAPAVQAREVKALLLHVLTSGAFTATQLRELVNEAARANDRNNQTKPAPKVEAKPEPKAKAKPAPKAKPDTGTAIADAMEKAKAKQVAPVSPIGFDL